MAFLQELKQRDFSKAFLNREHPIPPKSAFYWQGLVLCIPKEFLVLRRSVSCSHISKTQTNNKRVLSACTSNFQDPDGTHLDGLLHQKSQVLATGSQSSRVLKTVWKAELDPSSLWGFSGNFSSATEPIPRLRKFILVNLNHQVHCSAVWLLTEKKRFLSKPVHPRPFSGVSALMQLDFLKWIPSSAHFTAETHRRDAFIISGLAGLNFLYGSQPVCLLN